MNGVVDWLDRNADLLIGILAGGLLSWLTSWFFFVQQKQPKALDWKLNADERIVGAGEEYVGSRLNVEWDSIKLKHPRLISLIIQNTDKREIVEADYTDPITITVNGSLIFDAIVTDVSSPSLPSWFRSARYRLNGEYWRMYPEYQDQTEAP